MSILENIYGHEDLVRLSDEERTQLCREIREFLVSSVSETGGHLASNLGAVELSVAIETVFNTMNDRLVFDVGHQSYVHKLLTGRRADFAHLRQYGGMSGFPKPHESPADAFVAGHASSSVSIALGMARARTLLGQDYKVVVVIGDGAATGGMAYEGLNDLAVSKEPVLVILNDNEMSIDRNVGGVASHLSKIRRSDKYLKLKMAYRSFLKKIPKGMYFYNFTSRVKNRIKRAVLPSTIFENMGYIYFGPVDGHDLPELIGLMRSALQLNAPVLLHVVTRKGKGYAPAEADPAKFHGIGRFDPETGMVRAGKKETFSDSFGVELTRLAEQDHRICAITAAMPGGTGLLPFRDRYPERTFDVGIAEEHAVSMAGGLAKQGMVPVVALYSTFLQRAYDQILQDISMLGLHVVLAIDRAGLVGDDGETHHGVFDVGFLNQVPGMTVLAPASVAEQREMLRWAVQDCDGPVAVRYPRGGNGAYTDSVFDPGASVVTHRNGAHGAIVTYGTLVNEAMQAADILAQQGIDVSIVRLTKLKPFSAAGLESALTGCGKVLIAEEAICGIGNNLSNAIRDLLPDCAVTVCDLGNAFVPHGAVSELHKMCGLDGESLADRFMEVLHEN